MAVEVQIQIPMKTDINLLYVVNAHLPNDRANGVQIAHTCGAVGKHVHLTLATRMTHGETADSVERYGIQQTFIHKKLFCIDVPGMPLRYAVRNASFFFSVNVYALWFFLKYFFSGRRAALYVRGEVILALIPLSLIVPVFFETHQIRNFAWLYRIALRLSRGVVVVTERLKVKFVEEYGIPSEKILVARDAVDAGSFSTLTSDPPLWSRYRIPHGKKVVLYAGTLAPEKGVDTLAEAALLLPDTVHVVFLGGTDAQVQSFRSLYGKHQNVSIVGRVLHTEVPRHIVSADVLVLPDSAEYTYSNLYTSPMKLFEYMASGRPIVASDVPSLREVLTDDSAFFFKPDSPEALQKTINQALENPEDALTRGTRAKEMVTAYTWENRGSNIYRHITKLLKMEYYRTP